MHTRRRDKGRDNQADASGENSPLDLHLRSLQLTNWLTGPAQWWRRVGDGVGWDGCGGEPKIKLSRERKRWLWPRYHRRTNEAKPDRTSG